MTMPHYLKELGLTAMASNLEMRNQEALNHKLTYLEFISHLSTDEWLLRENRRYTRRLQVAHLNVYKTLETFDMSFNPTLDQKLVKDLVTCRFVEERNPVIVMGPCGTGKSHLAQAIGFCALKKGIDVLFTQVGELSVMLQTARATGTYEKKIKVLSQLPLLIIDDFALKPFTRMEEEDIHEIIVKRSEKASTLVTSNLTPNEWGVSFNNQLLGIATIDRLRYNAYVMMLEGASYRNQAKTRTSSSQDHKVNQKKKEQVSC